MAYLLRAIGLFFLLYAGKPMLETLVNLIQTRFLSGLGLTTGINILLFGGGLGLLLLREWARKVLRYACIGLILIQIAQPLMQLKINWGLLAPVVYYGIFIAVLSMPQAEASTLD